MKKSLISIILTISVLAILAIAGPAHAFSVSLSNPNNAYQGKDVKFDINMEIESADSFLPIKETKLLITGPNGFNETCYLDINGSISNCDLDLDIKKVKINSTYGYGYGYGYGYNFGYGYGFDDGKIKFKVIWHTDKSIKEGNYTAKVIVLVKNNLVSKEYVSEDVSFSIKEKKEKEDEDDEDDKKILICHLPSKDKDKGHTIKVSKNAVKAHLNHGDYLGKCDKDRDDDDSENDHDDKDREDDDCDDNKKKDNCDKERDDDDKDERDDDDSDHDDRDDDDDEEEDDEDDNNRKKNR